MSDLAKINTSHHSRLAYVYLRQSNPAFARFAER